MKHSEFEIGKHFFCGGNEWKCTDIGTRTIISIKISCIATGWGSRPPYDVAEYVFDEYDIQPCSISK